MGFRFRERRADPGTQAITSQTLKLGTCLPGRSPFPDRDRGPTVGVLGSVGGTRLIQPTSWVPRIQALSRG